MKMQLKRLLLIALLVFALTGLAACGGTPDLNRQPVPPAASEPSQSERELPEESSQVISPDSVESTGTFDCAGNETHSIGQSIAETYEVSYEQVMAWFCKGYSFENILIALETGEAVDVPADTLLQMLEEKDWEEIWVEVDFTGDQ